jgi:site-specific recombinase
MEANLIQIATFGLTVIITIVGVFAYLFSQRKHKVEGLMDAFKILNSNEHREGRKRVFQVADMYDKDKNIKVFSQPEVKRVMADFNVIGTLIKAGNIGRNLFLDEYGPTAYRCWKRVKPYIEDERKTQKF